MSYLSTGVGFYLNYHIAFEVVLSPPPGLNFTVSPFANLVKIAQLHLE
jgi:hypothetical protein